MVKFNEEEIRLLGRTASGVKAITLNDGDEVIGMSVMKEDGKLFTVSETGYGRISENDNYRTQSRGGKGLKNYHIEKYGEVAAISDINEEDDIILPEPPTDKKKDRKHSAWYTNGNLNLKMLDEACDYLCPYTKQFANSLAGKSPGPFNAGQICEIFDYCFKNWKYVNDPTGAEYVASASESIEGNLAGDCDDFAILIASCIMAIGGDACINTGGGAQGGLPQV